MQSPDPRSVLSAHSRTPPWAPWACTPSRGVPQTPGLSGRVLSCHGCPSSPQMDFRLHYPVHRFPKCVHGAVDWLFSTGTTVCDGIGWDGRVRPPSLAAR